MFCGLRYLRNFPSLAHPPLLVVCQEAIFISHGFVSIFSRGGGAGGICFNFNLIVLFPPIVRVPFSRHDVVCHWTSWGSFFLRDYNLVGRSSHQMKQCFSTTSFRTCNELWTWFFFSFGTPFNSAKLGSLMI